MSKPVAIPTWDSGSLNLIATTGIHQTNGWTSSEVPTSSEMNGWQQNVYLWLAWLNSYASIVYNGMGGIISTSSLTAGFFTQGYGFTCGAVSGSGNLDLRIPQGYKITQIKFNLYANTASPGGTIAFNILQAFHGAINTNLHTYTVANGSWPTTSTTQTLNLAASGSLAAQTVTVNAAGGTYTRSAGSYLTDGFFVGMTVIWAGFLNGGNNATKVITALTATVMTVSTTGLVNETSSASAATVNCVSPVVDDTFSYAVYFQLGGSGAQSQFVGVPRVTAVPV